MADHIVLLFGFLGNTRVDQVTTQHIKVAGLSYAQKKQVQKRLHWLLSAMRRTHQHTPKTTSSWKAACA
jgi:hypothetical protein